MKYNIIIRPDAKKDLGDSYQWYQDHVPGLGVEFMYCVDEALDRIVENPNLYQEIYKNVRRVLTRRFPYGIFYIIEGNDIIILAVFHVKRDPQLLKERRSE